MSKLSSKKRCPNGYRRNTKTKRCTKKNLVKKAKSKRQHRNKRVTKTRAPNRYTPSKMKYRLSRNSPWMSATHYSKGSIARGNDGRYYKVITTSRAKRWVLA